jgi:hypothetical protein
MISPDTPLHAAIQILNKVKQQEGLLREVMYNSEKAKYASVLFTD